MNQEFKEKEGNGSRWNRNSRERKERKGDERWARENSKIIRYKKKKHGGKKGKGDGWSMDSCKRKEREVDKIGTRREKKDRQGRERYVYTNNLHKGSTEGVGAWSVCNCVCLVDYWYFFSSNDVYSLSSHGDEAKVFVILVLLLITRNGGLKEINAEGIKK